MKKSVPGAGELPKRSAIEAMLGEAGINGLPTSMFDKTPKRTESTASSGYEGKSTSQILYPELSLKRLGFAANDPIDWRRSWLIEKGNLYVELSKRIKQKKNTDCKVLIGGEEFNCHLIVLQCFSELFDGYSAIKKIEIPADKCTAAAFSFIYHWMITEDKSYRALTRESVLDVLMAAKYLKIKDLVEQCWGFIDNTDVFNEDTAFLLYIDAKNKNIEEVQQLMIPRIQKFFLVLVSTQDWLQLDVLDVKSLLSSNYIRINCEIEIFMAAIRWLRFDLAGRDKYKHEIINCVRFGHIAAWQLIDLKRNSENTEFMEHIKDVEICKLLDDGLAYVIIKSWFGQEPDVIKHWMSSLELEEPQDRNWSGLEKTYFTYREFLVCLDQYRQSGLLERSKNKVSVSSAPSVTTVVPIDEELGGPSTVAIPSEEPMTTMEEFLKTNTSPSSSTRKKRLLKTRW